MLQQHLTGEIVLNPTEILQADLYPMGGNGLLDASDLLLLEQLLAAP